MIPKVKKFSNGAKVHPIGIGGYGVGDRDIPAIRYSLKKGQNHIDTGRWPLGGNDWRGN